MSEEKTEVALVSLPSVPAELEKAFIDDKFISDLIENIRTKASAVVGDLGTVKGRGVYISMAANVRRTKTMIDDAGKSLVAEMKKRPAMVDASRKRVRDEMDDLAIEIRKPVTDYEAEQARIAEEKAAEDERLRLEAEQLAAAEALKKQKEADHEIALLMNDKFDRDTADAKAEAERQRIAHEEELKRLAVEQANREAEEKIQREREAALQREADLKAQAALAESNRIAAAQKAEQDRIDAANKAESARLAAAQQAEREKQEAIAAEQLKAQQETQRIQREAQQKEDSRLAEEKRIADEAAKRAADKAYQAEVNNAAIAVLTKAGIDPECAKQCVIAIIKNQINTVLAGESAPIQIIY